MTSVAGHRTEPSGGGGTTVTLSFGWSGWLAWLVRLFYGKLARRYVRTEIESLKRRCERAGVPTQRAVRSAAERTASSPAWQ